MSGESTATPGPRASLQGTRTHLPVASTRNYYFGAPPGTATAGGGLGISYDTHSRSSFQLETCD